jgi:hypothetical protein
MLYDMNQELGHADVPCVHVPLEEYQVGGERHTRLWEAIEQAQRFTHAEDCGFNV